MEEELGLIDVLLPAPVDSPQDEFPIPREDGSLEGDQIADLPPESFGQFLSGNGALSIAEEGLVLIGRLAAGTLDEDALYFAHWYSVALPRPA